MQAVRGDRNAHGPPFAAHLPARQSPRLGTHLDRPDLERVGGDRNGLAALRTPSSHSERLGLSPSSGPLSLIGTRRFSLFGLPRAPPKSPQVPFPLVPPTAPRVCGRVRVLLPLVGRCVMMRRSPPRLLLPPASRFSSPSPSCRPKAATAGAPRGSGPTSYVPLLLEPCLHHGGLVSSWPWPQLIASSPPGQPRPRRSPPGSAPIKPVYATWGPPTPPQHCLL